MSAKADRFTIRDLFPIGEIAEEQEPYGGKPPCVAGSETSEEAADRIKDHVGRLQREVLAWLERMGDLGATCDEIETDLGLSHQTVSARLCELERKDWITKTTEKRQTRSGRRAFVYKAGNGAGKCTGPKE